MSNIFRCALVFISMSFANISYASLLSITPASSVAELGDSFSIDIVISGLGDGTAPTLGAFYIELEYDDFVLDFDSVTYGSSLGDTDPGAFETDIITDDGLGYVGLDLFSFLFDFELDAIQSDTFTLATLTFEAISVGVSDLFFGFSDLSDAEGGVLFPDFEEGSAEVVRGTSTVPLPSSLFLLGLGAAALVRVRAE